MKAIIGDLTIANELLKKSTEEDKMILCNTLISNGFGVKKASVLSGVPKSTYYNRLLIRIL